MSTLVRFLVIGVVVLGWHGTGLSQNTGYTPPPPSQDGYTPPEVLPEDDWFQTTWGSVSGTSLIRAGTEMIRWGLTTTGVLVADDATVVGVVDDPLILISGGTTVAGGVVLVVGGVKILVETWFD